MSELWEVLVPALPGVPPRFLITVELVVVSFVIAMAVGTLVAAFRVAPNPWLQRIGGLYVEFFRNVPLLVLMFIAYPGLRRAGVEISAFVAGRPLARPLHGGLRRRGDPLRRVQRLKGQIEASLSLGFTYRQTMRRIVLPQAFRTVISPLGSLIIAMIKNSAIIGGSILALNDLLKTGRVIASRSFEVIRRSSGRRPAT